MSDDRPIVCVDLDGVLNDYDGWKGADYFHPPRPGAREFSQQLNVKATASWCLRFAGVRTCRTGLPSTASVSLSRK